MKKIICRFLMVLMMVALIAGVLPGNLFQADSVYAASKSVKHFSVQLKASMKSMKLKWKKPKKVKVSYYKIYRVELKNNWFDDDKVIQPFSRYKKIAKVSGKKKSYTDKKVKTGKTYAYVIQGYKKKGKKAKLVCTTYYEDEMTYESVGLVAPELINGGYGEFDLNDIHNLYLYVNLYYGVKPSGIQVYRKSASDPKYKKMDLKTSQGKKLKALDTIHDPTVKPGETYTYKARGYKKVGKKTYYSPYSEEFTLSAVNLSGKYKVDLLTSPGDVSEIQFKITSDKYNGPTTFRQPVLEDYEDDGYYENGYYYKKDGKDADVPIVAGTAKYSKDGLSWVIIPKEGVEVKAGESIYLCYELYGGKHYFAGKTGTASTLYFSEREGADYDGSGVGYTWLTVDFVNGTAKAIMEFD